MGCVDRREDICDHAMRVGIASTCNLAGYDKLAALLFRQPFAEDGGGGSAGLGPRDDGVYLGGVL